GVGLVGRGEQPGDRQPDGAGQQADGAGHAVQRGLVRREGVLDGALAVGGLADQGGGGPAAAGLLGGAGGQPGRRGGGGGGGAGVQHGYGEVEGGGPLALERPVVLLEGAQPDRQDALADQHLGDAHGRRERPAGVAAQVEDQALDAVVGEGVEGLLDLLDGAVLEVVEAQVTERDAVHQDGLVIDAGHGHGTAGGACEPGGGPAGHPPLARGGGRAAR